MFILPSQYNFINFLKLPTTSSHYSSFDVCVIIIFPLFPSRHVYVYREPAPIASECQLRNRKSGKDVKHVAKQSVVTLDDNCELVGAQASNTSIIVATKNAVFTIRVNL